MRILFLCHRYQDTQVGGVAEVLQYLPVALKNLGTECILYTQAEALTSQLQGPIRLSNGLLHYSGPFIKPRLINSSKKLKPLLQLCRQEKIDLIHAHGTYRSGFMAMLAHECAQLPYVVTSHSDIVTANSRRMQRASVKRRCRKILQFASAVTHLTPLMVEASHHIFNTKNKDFIINNGIDISAWQRFADLPERNYLLAIGRLEPEKGFDVIIDAFAKLCKKNVNTSLVIAGSGSAELVLQNQVKSLGLNLMVDTSGSYADIPPKTVVFTGYIRGDNKIRLLSQCKILLFATQPTKFEEPFGIVLLEGMAAGKAIIASDIYATRYINSKGAAICLVQPDDPNLWALTIENLFDDSNQREQSGIINLAASKQFAWDTVARHYQAVYNLIFHNH